MKLVSVTVCNKRVFGINFKLSPNVLLINKQTIDDQYQYY